MRKGEPEAAAEPVARRDRRTVAAVHRVGRKVHLIVALAVALPVLSLLVEGVRWRSTTEFHNALEILAAGLALVVGLGALMRYHARPSNAVLFLGVAFLGAGLLDGAHVLSTSGLLHERIWNAGRLYLAVTLLLGAWAWRREQQRSSAGRIPAGMVYLASGGAIAAALAVFALVPWQRWEYPGAFFSRPLELVTAFVLVTALVAHWRKGVWRRDSFEYAIVLSLVVGITAEASFAARAVALHDPLFDLGHALKLASYLIVAIGLLREIHLGFVEVELGAEALTELNAALECELVQRELDHECLEELNAQLERSNQELDDFAYIASHDLKEPLRGIHNYATFVLEDHGEQLPAEGRDKLATLVRLAQRMEALIDSLLHFSRMGRCDLAVAETDLNETLAEVVESLQFSIEEKGVELRIPQTLPRITCDRVRIREVFHNLITNAIKYNDKECRWVEIGWDEEAGECVFHVRDNGIGIRERHREAVFKIFKRLHGRDKFGGGNGAGMTITKKIVERHGGRIWFDSSHGAGTVFHFSIPTEVGASDAGAPEREPGDSDRRGQRGGLRSCTAGA